MGVYGNGYIIKKVDYVAEATAELNNELYNFNRLIESIDILNEQSIILEFSFKDITDKIKELWNRFVDWIKRIWNKIFHKNKDIESSVEDTNKNLEAAKKVVEETKPEDIEKKEESEEEQPKPEVKKTSKAPKTKITTTTPTGKKEEVEVKAKVSKDEELDVTLKSFKFDVFPDALGKSLKELDSMKASDIFGFLWVIEHDAMYNITMTNNDMMNNVHLDAISHLSSDEYVEDHFNATKVIGRANIKEEEKRYFGPYSTIVDKYNSEANSDIEQVKAAVKAYNRYIKDIEKASDEVQKILASGEENIRKYIVDSFKKINAKEQKGKEQTDEQIELFAQKLLPKVSAIISKDVARGQKIIDIMNGSISKCQSLINKYSGEKVKLIKLGVTSLSTKS